MNVERLVKIIFECILRINERFKDDIENDGINTTLFGAGGIFDSLDLVTFVIYVESELKIQLNVDISLTSEKAMSYRNSPFRTVDSLITFILEEYEQRYNANNGSQ